MQFLEDIEHDFPGISVEVAPLPTFAGAKFFVEFGEFLPQNRGVSRIVLDDEAHETKKVSEGFVGIGEGIHPSAEVQLGGFGCLAAAILFNLLLLDK